MTLGRILKLKFKVSEAFIQISIIYLLRILQRNSLLEECKELMLISMYIPSPVDNAGKLYFLLNSQAKFSRFAYEEGVWRVYDGSNNKESTNGTWVSLTDFRIKNERQESEPREIFHGTEIKISDTIIKVFLFNFILITYRFSRLRFSIMMMIIKVKLMMR